MKLAAVTPVWNEPILIKGCIKSLAPHVDKHIILVSQKPYYGTGVPDNTADIAESLGADVIRGEWPLDHHQRNLGISLLQDYDWIITADADEMITGYNMQILKKDMQETEHNALTINHYPYWRNTNYVLKDFFKPIFAVRPSARFNHIRNVDCSFGLSEAYIHHLSWSDPKDILQKITTYSHTDEMECQELWHESVYLPWTPKDGGARMPTGELLEVVNNPLPDELKRYIS